MNTALHKSGFSVIPIEECGGIYWIDADCNILQYGETESHSVYVWDPETADIPIELMRTDGTTMSITPIRLYLFTYYGIANFRYIDNNMQAPANRYHYKVRKLEELDDGTLIIDEVKFKWSDCCRAFVNEYGCSYRDGNFVRHTIDQKGYHSIRNRMIGKPIGVHRAIYDAWVGITDPSNEIHHKDCNNWNNQLKNLQELSKEEHKRVHERYPDDVVYEVCRLMSEGVRPTDAARMMQIPPVCAVAYRNGARSNISSLFTYPELPGFKLSKLNDDLVREICELFVNTNLSNSQIGEKYGVDRYTIQDIRKRITWRNISCDYDFSSADPGVKTVTPQTGNKRNASITEEQVVEIYKQLLSGKRIIDVSKATGVSYGIVKKIKYKTRWASITDKIDSQIVQ